MPGLLEHQLSMQARHQRGIRLLQVLVGFSHYSGRRKSPIQSCAQHLSALWGARAGWHQAVSLAELVRPSRKPCRRQDYHPSRKRRTPRQAAEQNRGSQSRSICGGNAWCPRRASKGRQRQLRSWRNTGVRLNTYFSLVCLPSSKLWTSFVV